MTTATTAPPSTALALIETITAVELFKPGALDPILERIEKEAREEASKLDISTEVNRTALKSLAYKVARSKTFVEKQRIALVADQKEQLKKIDREGGRIWDRLEALQQEIRKPLTDWENLDKARVAEHEAALTAIEGAAKIVADNWQRLTPENIAGGIAKIESDTRDWQEFSQRAAGVKAVAVNSMKHNLADAQKLETERAELKRLKAEEAERVAKAREEAAALAATQAAEKKAKDAAEAIERARETERQRMENERAEADARAKYEEKKRVAAEQEAKRQSDLAESRRVEAAAQAKRDQELAIERERQRVAAESERERVAAEKREANKRHVAKINREVKQAIMHCGGSTINVTAAEAIVAAIAKGLIPHTTISY